LAAGQLTRDELGKVYIVPGAPAPVTPIAPVADDADDDDRDA
jgi:hypothetical protein